MQKNKCKNCIWWTGKEWRALGRECMNPEKIARWTKLGIDWEESTRHIKPGSAPACMKYEEAEV